MKIEQKRIMGMYDYVLIWEVTDAQGKIETFSNYNDAYKRFVYLLDGTVLKGRV